MACQVSIQMRTAPETRAPTRTTTVPESEQRHALGPPEAMVRRDLQCPKGEITFIGGMAAADRIVLRKLAACGLSATYRRFPGGSWKKSE